MCGRTACTLTLDNMAKALCYKTSESNKFLIPKWSELQTTGKKYIPSHNISPSDVTPVLVSGRHLGSQSERLLVPMMWGMIPHWHKGDLKSHKLPTSNCRIEKLATSKLYKHSFLGGKRCVVVCDGFYEWRTTEKQFQKQPYFIYMTQPDGIRVEDPLTWNTDYNENQGWKGVKLLKMAAVFDHWTSPKGEKLFSYSIITTKSNQKLSWLTDRMPVILDSEDEVNSWMNSGNLTSQLTEGTEALSWHLVSPMMNNARNKSANCNKPISEDKTNQRSRSAKFMEAWLKSSGSKRSNEKNDIEAGTSKVLKRS